MSFSYVEQYVSKAGTSVITINPGTPHVFKISNVKVRSNESAIITSNINFQYFINDKILIDVQRNGNTITNGTQNLFSTTMDPGNQYPMGNFTSTFVVSDNPDKLCNEYSFVISSSSSPITILQGTFIARIVSDKDMTSVQGIPRIPTDVFVLAPQEEKFIDLPAIKNNKNNNKKCEGTNVSLNACTNFVITNGSSAQAEIIDGNGNSLTGGLQDLTNININTNTQSYEVNINLNVVDFKTKGPYKLHLKNSTPLFFNQDGTSNLLTNIITLDYFSFTGFISNNSDVSVQSNFPILNQPAAIVIPPSGSHVFNCNLESKSGNLRRFKLLTNVNTDFIIGEHFLLADVKRNGKSIIDGQVPFLSLSPSVGINSLFDVYDNNLSGEYTVELLNIGPSPLSIDYFNLVELVVSGRLNVTYKKEPIPIISNSTVQTAQLAKATPPKILELTGIVPVDVPAGFGDVFASAATPFELGTYQASLVDLQGEATFYDSLGVDITPEVVAMVRDNQLKVTLQFDGVTPYAQQAEVGPYLRRGLALIDVLALPLPSDFALDVAEYVTTIDPTAIAGMMVGASLQYAVGQKKPSDIVKIELVLARKDSHFAASG